MLLSRNRSSQPQDGPTVALCPELLASIERASTHFPDLSAAQKARILRQVKSALLRFAEELRFGRRAAKTPILGEPAVSGRAKTTIIWWAADVFRRTILIWQDLSSTVNS
ncbi:hypothetical protein DFH09DRAFT_1339614 [Mycena vulgaris]|nr:hypothetical protein DFH09DRAFT_1339614 [Mycena vulgaris]